MKMRLRGVLLAIAACWLDATDSRGGCNPCYRWHPGQILIADPQASTEPGKLIGIDGTTQFVASPSDDMQAPFWVVMAPNGDALVSDQAGTIWRIPRIDNQPIEPLSVGGAPYSLAIAPDGMLFAVDTSEGRIVRIDPSTGEQTPIQEAGSFFDPQGMTIAPDGKIYVVERGDDAVVGDESVLEIDPTSGNFLRTFTWADFVRPKGITFLNGRLLVTDADSFDKNGALFSLNADGGWRVLSDATAFNNPQAAAIDADGQIIVTDRGNVDTTGDERIFRVNPATGAATLITENGYLHTPWGIAVVRVPTCGNGRVDVEEQCDGGPCCTPRCTFAVSSTVCRPSTGTCDPQETCTGSASTCPGEVFSSSTTVCRSAAGDCDLAEHCTGSSGPCPPDVLVGAGSICRTANGTCDLAESCTGVDAACPVDKRKNDGSSCSDGSACTDNDQCQAGNCVPGPLLNCNDGDVCVLGTCDRLTGCQFAPVVNGSPCNDGSACTQTDTCQAGVCTAGPLVDCNDQNPCTIDTCQSPSGCQHSPNPAPIVCRPATGACDVAEVCPGDSTVCPPDQMQPSGTTCRSAAGACDLAETCTGASVNCPSDQKSVAACRAVAAACDVAESCDGVSNNCPTNGFVPSGTRCRAATGACDVAETCTGSSATCPTDGFVAAGTICRASAGVCDLAETCSGTSATCPADQKSTAVCRIAASGCDAAESCDGVGNLCPSDVVAAAGTTCRAAAGACDVAEVCDGSSNACPADTLVTAGTQCRAVAGVCDLAETCSGSSAACPANGFVSAGISCRVSAGVCDVAETCSGSSATCPADAFLGATTVCRVSLGACDPAETCDGSPQCPTDVLLRDGTSCENANATCTGTDVCKSGVCEDGDQCGGVDAPVGNDADTAAVVVKVSLSDPAGSGVATVTATGFVDGPDESDRRPVVAIDPNATTALQVTRSVTKKFSAKKHFQVTLRLRITKAAQRKLRKQFPGVRFFAGRIVTVVRDRQARETTKTDRVRFVLPRF